MADPSPSPAPQDSSNPDPNPSQNPNPNPNLTPPASQPDPTTQPPSSTPPPPTINPNPTTAPPFPPPPQINPYTGAPSFRPAGAPAPIPVPQFTPIPNMPGFPAQPNHGVPLPPPGVTSAPPQQQPMLPLRPPYMAMPNGYLSTVPQGSLPPGVVRYPYPPGVRPPYLRPGIPVGTIPPLPRPFLGLRPPVLPPVARPPILPVVTPAEKPQTTVYVGKIAPSVENDFIRSLLELCGPIKSWKRAQDPSDGTPRRFGFCEFESAEGVLRALRLLSKCNVDGEELVLNVNQATREYLERYVQKKKENLNKPGETVAEEAKKEGESAPDGEKGEGNEKTEPVESGVEEPKKDLNETENKENDTASFGLVTDEDRDADRQASEKLTNMIEERIRTKPPPPPPPPAQKVVDGTNNSNSEFPAKSGDKDSDITTQNVDKNDDETTSETKPTNRAGTVSPDRSRRYDNRSRDRERDRDRQVKERELDRLERERERERARREKERELEIQKVERFYKERVKEWETREKEREYERQREREKEKERERERRRLIAEQEDESDDDSRKRRRKSEVEDKRRRRKREKEEDLADRLKEEEELVEAKKRKAAEEEEERRRQQEKQALDLFSAPLANGSEMLVLPETTASESKDDMMEQDHDSDSAPPSRTGDGTVENGSTDEPMIASGSTSDVKLMGNAPAKKLGFGLVGSGKRMAVPSVFHEEEDDDAQKEKKMRPLVPIDYSTEELQAVHTNDGEAPPVSAVSAETGKRVNPRDGKSDVERDRSRRPHDRTGHRDRERDDEEAPRAREILDAKQLIDMIPKTKDDLFSYEINWVVYDENRLHERMRPWISKKITEFLGEEETTLVEFIVDRFREHVKAEKMLDVLQRILDEEAEMFVLKMWRMLIFEIKKVETGLTARPGA